MGRPMRTGPRPGSPVSDIAPPIAWSARSKAGQSRYGPSCPYAEIEQRTTRWFSAQSFA